MIIKFDISDYREHLLRVTASTTECQMICIPKHVMVSPILPYTVRLIIPVHTLCFTINDNKAEI